MPATLSRKKVCSSTPSYDERLDHIECAYLLLRGRHTAERIAALYGVSRATVWNWRKLALTYDDPEAIGLRRLAGLPEID
jgi:hypothetical protein